MKNYFISSLFVILKSLFAFYRFLMKALVALNLIIKFKIYNYYTFQKIRINLDIKNEKILKKIVYYKGLIKTSSRI